MIGRRHLAGAVVVASLLVTSGVGAQWSAIAPTVDLPSPRYDHATAWDPTGGRLLLFGGTQDGSSGLADTWIYDLDQQAWRNLTPVAGSPPARWGHTLVFDLVRDEFVLFGGTDGTQLLDDLWVWNPSTRVWSEKTLAAPRPAGRAGHVMVWDRTAGRGLLFGGDVTGLGLANDTWHWDGAAWTEDTTSTPPPARTDHAAAWLVSGARMVVFGGSLAGGPTSDTWEYDPAIPAWTDRGPASPPAARAGHALAAIAGDQVLLVAGDGGAGGIDDAWVWDTTAGTWTASTNGAGARDAHAMTDVGAVGEVLVTGGSSGIATSLQTFHRTAAGTWTVPTPAAYGPTSRDGHAMAWHPTAGLVTLFGGEDVSGLLNDVWGWDPASERWLELTPRSAGQPGARRDSILVYDSANSQVVLFGGNDGASDLDDTWTWNGASWLQRAPPVRPAPRSGHGGTFDLGRSELVVHGGLTAGVQTWTWLGGIAQWTPHTPVSGPGQLDGISLAYDVPRGSVLLFGGHDGAAERSETWLWSGAARTWASQSPSLVPPARWGHVSAFDPTRSEVLMFGGEDTGGLLGDSWAWTGSDWEAVGGAGPPARRDTALAFAGTEGILFGGRGTLGRLDDLWRYESLPAGPFRVDLTPADGAATACDTEVVTLQVVDSADVPVAASVNVQVSVVSSGANTPQIIATTLGSPSITPASLVTGTTLPTGSATVTVTLDEGATVTVSVVSGALPGTSSPVDVVFSTGGVDTANTAISVDPTAIRAGEDTAVLTVRPRDACGADLAPGRNVTFTPSYGSVGAVTEVGDGTYTADFTTAAAECPGSAATIDVGVDGMSVGTLDVDSYCPTLDLAAPISFQSSSLACASLGVYASLVVTPRARDGRPLPAVPTVSITESPPSIVLGSIETATEADGATTFTLRVGSDRCGGPARPIPVSVDGQTLVTVPEIVFTCPDVDPASLAIVPTPDSAPADGESPISLRVSGVDECGNPPFNRSATVAPLEGGAPLDFEATRVDTVDAFGQPDDGTATFIVRGTGEGVFGISYTLDGVGADAPNLITFTGAGLAAIDYRPASAAAVVGQRVRLLGEVRNLHDQDLRDVVLTGVHRGLRIDGVEGASELGEGRYRIESVPASGSTAFAFDAIVQPSGGRAQSYFDATYVAADSPLLWRTRSQTATIRVSGSGGAYGCECSSTRTGPAGLGLLLVLLGLRRGRR